MKNAVGIFKISYLNNNAYINKNARLQTFVEPLCLNQGALNVKCSIPRNRNRHVTFISYN